MVAAAEEKKPFIVHCRDCRHEWAAFYFPLTLDKKGIGLMRAAAKHCPKCANRNVYVGPAPAAPQQQDAQP